MQCGICKKLCSNGSICLTIMSTVVTYDYADTKFIAHRASKQHHAAPRQFIAHTASQQHHTAPRQFVARTASPTIPHCTKKIYCPQSKSNNTTTPHQDTIQCPQSKSATPHYAKTQFSVHRASQQHHIAQRHYPFPTQQVNNTTVHQDTIYCPHIKSKYTTIHPDTMYAHTASPATPHCSKK
jgi:hypothetical protein